MHDITVANADASGNLAIEVALRQAFVAKLVDKYSAVVVEQIPLGAQFKRYGLAIEVCVSSPPATRAFAISALVDGVCDHIDTVYQGTLENYQVKPAITTTNDLVLDIIRIHLLYSIALK